jgi:hypothetical protein
VRGFRRDLTLANGPGFRLRRRTSTRVLSAAGVLGGAALAVAHVRLGQPLLGAVLALLALAFLVQLIWAELDAWRFDGRAAVHREVVLRQLALRETRVALRQIRGVQVEFVGRRARAWIETVRGEEYPLVEGDSDEVERIADRLSAQLRLASSRPSGMPLH